ncbi:major facilitator superfamily MFS_1 [Prosthecochloris aestuarii DSM 271]|uniref:Major facilitator superfamily MFS_1 n=1 Tax=Prosthecochloris aestuarii (strain DSM 271 / SK 413) TaxID=290512 RepID=B4S357_PROA2|nr:MFS transporter [Prosthecochloris aestuarii]ACF45151.1 major facilitator superfamily MFS_1 [Prosthecochloris aestuarii DSM 271]
MKTPVDDVLANVEGYDSGPDDGSGSRLKTSALSAFPAFRSRNFRLYFIGQIVSMIGTWLQMVAQGWLVLEMTGSAFWVGVTAAASSLPTLFLSLFGGVIVDRYDRRTILLWTQSASMLLALVLGVFTLTGTVTLAIILVLAFLLGCIAAVATPAIQAFLSEMVDRDQLHSAVALNSSIFNASRVIGPAIAGFMISWIGTGGAFIANGMSYSAVILALLGIHTVSQRTKPAVELSPLQSIREGLLYTRYHPLIRTIILFVAVVSIFGWSFMSMLPVVAKQTFGLGSEGMGFLFSAFGLGSLSGTVLVSMASGRVHGGVMVTGGILLFSLALTAFTFAPEEGVAMGFLFFAGIGLLSAFATMTATVQGLVEDRYRGRVMSIYLMVLMGFMPIGNLQVGMLSEHFGTSVAIRIGSLIVLAATMVLFSLRHRIEGAWNAYERSGEP